MNKDTGGPKRSKVGSRAFLVLLFALAGAAAGFGFVYFARGGVNSGHSAYLAKRSALLGSFGGALLGAVFLREQAEKNDELDTQICPHCAERIKQAAKVCKHCGRDVVTAADASS